MKVFGWSEDYIELELTTAKSWAFWCWAVENEGSVFGKMFERKTDGYIAQERRKILSKKP